MSAEEELADLQIKVMRDELEVLCNQVITGWIDKHHTSEKECVKMRNAFQGGMLNLYIQVLIWCHNHRPEMDVETYAAVCSWQFRETFRNRIGLTHRQGSYHVTKEIREKIMQLEAAYEEATLCLEN